MEDTIYKVISQAPALGVLVFLVIVFLKHLRSEGSANRKSLVVLQKSLEHEGEANRAALAEVTEAMKERWRKGDN